MTFDCEGSEGIARVMKDKEDDSDLVSFELSLDAFRTTGPCKLNPSKAHLGIWQS